MQLLKTVEGLRCALARLRLSRPVRLAASTSFEPMTVGFVPTMGALHAGHLSLIQRARQDNDVVVVSIFVNPLQFAPTEDLAQYPRSLDQDQAQCAAAGVDILFVPTVETLYGVANPDPAALTQVILPTRMISGLCGRFRPGHFQGVATIVTKLISLVQPDLAYFGQKDAQQLAILKQVAADLNLPGELVGCPIVREPDGLAMSSRNQYLTPTERQQATQLYRGLQAAQHVFQQGERSGSVLIDTVNRVLADEPGIRPQYVELVHPKTMEPLDRVDTVGLLAIAAFVGSTRLIDNLMLRSRQPIVAIDGPAGAGKSTVARRVAAELGLLYLDTGAMYRAVTWKVLQQGIDPTDPVAVAEIVTTCEVHLSSAQENAPSPPTVWIDGQDVTQAIRSHEVTANVSAIAAQSVVRRALVQQQQRYGIDGGVVMEGRDIGTHVFPNAELKLFLTASVQERARRRQQDLKVQQQPMMSLEAIEQAIFERDRKDSTRAIAPLQKAADAIEIDTDSLTIDDVVTKIVLLYRSL